MEPTEQQKLVIDFDENAVVIAAPGSGKTFVISEKIKLNLKDLLDYQGVVAISYTNKASAELRHRSLSNGENPKSSFFGTIDNFNISEIIIPFGKQLFGIPKLQIEVLNTGDLPNEDKDDFAWFDRLLPMEQVTELQWDIIKSYFFKGRIMIETVGIIANYIITNSIACKNYIKARYKYIYIDEYQDSGLEQHQIFLKIKDLGVKAIAVGDLNQSIYGFSGKDSKHLAALTTDPEFGSFKLDKNHRSHPSIINYSNYLLDRNTKLIPTEQNLIFFKRVDGAEKEIATWLDENIKFIEEAFKITARNRIAILTRLSKTAEILNVSLKEPHKLSVSTELDTHMNVWSAIFSSLLKFMLDDKYNFIDVIEEFTTYDRFNNRELEVLSKCKIEIKRLALIQPIEWNKLTDEFVKVASIIAPNATNATSIELLTKVLSDSIQMKSYEPANENEVNILTLHKSKGLEYDFIFHLDLYEWVLPKKVPGAGNDFKNPTYPDKQQDLNLHYVGITRARKGCFLLSSTQRTNYKDEIKQGKDSEFLWDNKIEELRYKVPQEK